MRAVVITVEGSEASAKGVEDLRNSSEAVGNDFLIEVRNAPPLERVHGMLEGLGLSWTHPLERETVFQPHGLRLKPYKTHDIRARISCFLAHLACWQIAEEFRLPVLVLEDDTVFTRKLSNPNKLLLGGHGMVGINDPRGATRRAAAYHAGVANAGNHFRVITPPWVDSYDVPQGLAGASAYIIAPWAAALLMDKAMEVGAWPNDSLAIRQFFPWLGQSVKYYTKVSGRPSSLA